MNRNDVMEIGVPPARRWLTLLALVTAAVLATLAAAAVPSSPAEANSHRGGGGGSAVSTMAARVAALEARTWAPSANGAVPMPCEVKSRRSIPSGS
jgi:hypothetical protein